MDFDRLNPVALISGATFGLGAACARPIAHAAEGGLIIVDRDAALLEKLADKLGEQGAAPERVSMLANDGSDANWWDRAGEFIKGQYGRLDWAIINACPPPLADGDLVDWKRDASAQLESAFQTLRTVMPLMRFNSQGGAIVVIAPASSIKPEPGLLQLIRAAAREAAEDNIRVNAIATESADAAALQSFQNIVRETGSERAAFEIIANLSPPLARYAAGDDVMRLLLMLLTDDAPVTGATLVVEGGYTL